MYDDCLWKYIIYDTLRDIKLEHWKRPTISLENI